MRHLRISYILLALLASIVCACSTQRHAAIESSSESSSESSGLSLDKRFSLLTSAYTGWSDVYMPVNLRLQQPSSLSVSGRCTMVRGREIHISMRVLGMEVAVVYANTDSVFAVDKFHKMYLAESLGNILKGYDLTISDIQDLLIGHAFMPGAGTLAPDMASSFSLHQSLNSTSWNITPRKTTAGIEWFFTASSDATPTIESLTVTPRGRDQIQCIYSGIEDSPAGPVAQNGRLKAPLGKNNFEADFRFNFGSAKWNQDRKIKFALPRGYNRIDMQSLVKNLKSM